MLLFTACKEHDSTQSLKTQFNDDIIIRPYLSGNLHGKYLCCEITAKNVEGCVYLWNREMLEIPENIGSSVECITIYNDVRIYKLYNDYIIIQGGKMDSISIDYDLNDLLREINYNGVKVDVVYSGVSALCKTKKFKFISQFLPILEYIKQDKTVNEVVERWAINDFTDDELKINCDYVREEIVTWCNNYLQRKENT